MRDIVNPNAAINPDYVSYQITLKNGELMTGLVKDSSADALTVVDRAAQTHRIPRNTIRSLRASSTSLMPEGLPRLGNKGLTTWWPFYAAGREKTEPGLIVLESTSPPRPRPNPTNLRLRRDIFP